MGWPFRVVRYILPKIVINSYIIALIFTALTDNEPEIKIDIKQKIFVLISF